MLLALLPAALPLLLKAKTFCSNGLTFTGNGTIASDGTVTVNYNATYDPGTGPVTDACTAIIE
jgi:hypothetical protein